MKERIQDICYEYLVSELELKFYFLIKSYPFRSASNLDVPQSRTIYTKKVRVTDRFVMSQRFPVNAI